MATNPKSLSNIAPGKFITLEKVHPLGTLQARKQANGLITFYWRCTMQGRDFREPIGAYNSKCPPLSLEPTAIGYSRRAAAIKAAEIATLHRQNLAIGGLAGLRKQQDTETAKANAAKQAEQEEQRRHDEARSKFTLEALLRDYCLYLQNLGRQSHSDALSIFTNHVFGAFPGTAAKPAADVTTEQIADMMRKLIEAGKDRTANKLRSYVRAAYQVAKAAKSKPSIPLAFKGYGITTNPAADTSPDESANRPDKRPLSLEDLRTYWQILQTVDGIQGVALRMHLLSGGQRVAQLMRLLDDKVSGDVITIYDGKGRPGKPPRAHPIPVNKALKKELEACAGNAPYRLSTDGGSTHIAAGNLGKWAVAAVGNQIPGFLLKRVRSGVETALAGAKVSKDHRGRLQSHGITGVQATHYDGHDYLDEKRESMDKLLRLLNQPKETVVQFPKRKKA
jgi:integrase